MRTGESPTRPPSPGYSPGIDASVNGAADEVPGTGLMAQKFPPVVDTGVWPKNLLDRQIFGDAAEQDLLWMSALD